MIDFNKRIVAFLVVLAIFLLSYTAISLAAGDITAKTAVIEPTSTLAVENMPEADRQHYAGDFWRLDAEDNEELPKNFRTSLDAVGKVAGILPDITGMDKLKISGSGQMSESGMEVLLETLRTKTDAPIYIVDLRQETHGYLDGTAVSWYGKRNWGNIGKKTEDIIKAEPEFLQAAQAVETNVYPLDKSKHKAEDAVLTFTPLETKTEVEVATEYGANYFRITSTDHIWTSPENIDRFIAFYKTLPSDVWLHFHCMAGEGRTTTYMVLYDILKNGKNVSLADIAARQYVIGGIDIMAASESNKMDTQTSDKAINSWKQSFGQERTEMIPLFYQYVRENPKLDITWSEWLHHVKQVA
jgi:hypothetical protein